MRIDNAPLGHATQYVDQYHPDVLFPVARAQAREGLGLSEGRPFFGYDRWNAYELSWLNAHGKPCIATGQFIFPADSPNIVESKSLKLYLNSLNQAQFDSIDAVQAVMQNDLDELIGAPVKMTLNAGGLAPVGRQFEALPGTCLDDLPIQCDRYTLAPELLISDPRTIVTQALHSHLLRSRCPVTGQPDWASVLISYTGPKLIPESLLAYLISFRLVGEFHEHCIERMFVDLTAHAAFEALSIAGYFTRRGGVDINPVRSTHPVSSEDFIHRLWRQ